MQKKKREEKKVKGLVLKKRGKKNIEREKGKSEVEKKNKIERN